MLCKCYWIVLYTVHFLQHFVYGGRAFFSRTRCVNLYFLWDEFAVTAQSSGFGLRAQTLSTLKPLASSLCNGSSLCRTSGFYAALTRGRIKCCILSVCLSVSCLQFSRNGKAVETSNLVEISRLQE